ncbi:outer membrane protein assembly factor [Balneola sp. MJW-20]|uniref:BamA/OMP85 family outer membrane protein n=1 Tax=Gracilimonas aurantiaca TaxID=3234185 RepID=UPI0034663F50
MINPQINKKSGHSIAKRLKIAAFLFLFLSVPGVLHAQNEKDPRVWDIEIYGNDAFRDLILKNNIAVDKPSVLQKLFFFTQKGFYLDELELRRDEIRIQRFYQRRGYNEVEVRYRIEEKHNRDWKKTVIFDITENKPILIDTVQFFLRAAESDSLLISDNLEFRRHIRRLNYRKGRVYEPVRQSEVISQMVGGMHELGYPWAYSEVQASVDTTGKRAALNIINTPGARATFDSVLITGERTLPAKYIRRETGIKKGQYYDDKAIRSAQREVFNHHLLQFAIVSLPEQPEDSTVDVQVRIKEAPLRSLQFKIGAGNFQSLEGFGDWYKVFRGQLTWIHRNVALKGHRFSASLRASGFEQRAGLDYLFPYVFNTKSSFIISPFFQHRIERGPGYEVIRGGITNSFVYQYNSQLTGTASYQYTLNDQINSVNQEVLPDSVINYDISSFTFNAYYGAGVREGRQGWVFQPFLEVAGLFGEGSFSFQKASLDIRKYTPVLDGLVLANRISGGGIYYSAQDSLPQDILLYNGGTNDVRGWNRFELGPQRPRFDDNGNFQNYVAQGGRVSFTVNTELRLRIDSFFKGFGIAAFLDGGQVWRTWENVSMSDLQFGLGGGLRYQSPVGPIRIDIARKLNPSKQDLNIYQGVDYGSPWDRWGIHFSIGQAF